MHLKGPVGVMLFALLAGVPWNGQVALSVELFEQVTAIFKQSFAQAQFNGCAIAHPMALQILANNPQEGLGFLELSVEDLLSLEFFLLSEASDSRRVI